MEDDVRAFLIRIMQSISVGLVWLLLNMTIGIYYGYAFFEGRANLGNVIYYVAFIVSLVLLIRYLKKKWKGWNEINY